MILPRNPWAAENFGTDEPGGNINRARKVAARYNRMIIVKETVPLQRGEAEAWQARLGRSFERLEANPWF